MGTIVGLIVLPPKQACYTNETHAHTILRANDYSTSKAPWKTRCPLGKRKCNIQSSHAANKSSARQAGMPGQTLRQAWRYDTPSEIMDIMIYNDEGHRRAISVKLSTLHISIPLKQERKLNCRTKLKYVLVF